MSEPTIVCVLGMHRSGTSLVMRALNLLGLDLGPKEHLMRPGPANPAGHWENRLIKEINDDVLERLGGSWSEPPELAAGWESRPELAEPRRRARNLIEADFPDSDLWGFKDPRNSLTAPFWQRILPPMHYVICLRNPVDVAASLEAREEEPVPFEQGVELWLAYVRGALAATAGRWRQLIFYEDLMADPEAVGSQLARFIGRHQSDEAEAEARGAIRGAMSESLWHHHTPLPNVVDAGGLAFHVKALYLALRLFVPSTESVGTEVLDLFGAYAADAGRQIAELDDRRAEVEQRLSERDAELEANRRELEKAREELRTVERERAELERLRRELEADQADAPDSSAGEAPAPSDDYRRLVAEIRARVQETIPDGATVLVASKGDDALLQLDGRRGWHFPCETDGRYAGHHPSGDTAAIAQLEALRAQGADHLLLPATTLWWLDHYQGLRRHLEDRYVPVFEDEHCAIYRLSSDERKHASEPIAMLERTVASARVRTGRDLSILDWGTGLGIAERLPETLVFSPPDDGAGLPYLDGTVDIVVLDAADAARIGEARRVAGSAVIKVDPKSPERGELEWLGGGPSGWGEDVSVTLFPDADASRWDATLGAFGETLGEGFAGVLSVVGEPAKLRPASEAVAGGPVRLIEVPAGASLADRARTAAKATDRRVHVLVAAPAVPLPGWLPPILALLSPDRDAGVVGTRTLSRDGRLEEAGGILTADGRRRRRGEGDHDPDRPEYRFVRRVDFCSPPLLATRRDLFERLAGFDRRRVAPADALVDFSLRARHTGTPVYYQPEARVVTIGNGR